MMGRSLFTALVVCALVGPASAEPIVFEADGDYAVVRIEGATATALTASGRSDRVEVKIASGFDANTKNVHDDTVKRVDVRNVDGIQVISVQLRHGRDTTKRIAGAARIVQRGTSLEIALPRASALATLGKTPTAPKAIVPVEPAPQIEMDPDPVDPIVNVAAEAAVATATEQEEPEAIAALAPSAPAAPKGGPPAALKDGSSAPAMGLGPMLGIIALFGAAAIVLVIARKKKGLISADDGLEVLATRSLGPKAKIVWIAAGRREMVISVGAKGIRVLSAWKRDRKPSFEAADDFFPAGTPLPHGSRVTPLPTARVQSPAVSGLVKLRQERAQKIEDDFFIDEESDVEWAREVLGSQGDHR